MMEAKNGYLYIVEDHKDGELKPPLFLTSTNVMLRLLLEEDSWQLSSLETSTAEAQASEKQASEEQASEEHASEEHASEEHASEEQASSFVHLVRAENLADRTLKALTHIQMCKQTNPDAPKKREERGQQSRNAIRVKALEHQQQRLQQVQQDDNDAMDEDQPIRDPPNVRIARTLNSIRVLFPLLLPILLHPQRRDNEVEVGINKKKLPPPKNKKRKSCWLFGRKVYDTTSTTLNKTLLRQIREIICMNLCIAPTGLPVDGEIPDDVILSAWKPYMEDSWWSTKWLNATKVWNCFSQTTTPSLFVSPLERLLTMEPSKESSPTSSQDQMNKRLLSWDEQFFPPFDSMDQAHEQQRLYEKAVERLHSRLQQLLQKAFPGSKVRLSVYGSCLSQLSFKGSDVDMSLSFTNATEIRQQFESGQWSASRYEKEMVKLVRKIARAIPYNHHRPEFSNIIPVTQARVPVIKGRYLRAQNPYTMDTNNSSQGEQQQQHHHSGYLDFDICLLNDIAVSNSNLIREYSIIHPKVRHLMITVKKWAKEHHLCSAQHNSLSSYAWLNMVIFYLLSIGCVPNLQEETSQFQRNPSNEWHNISHLNTFFCTWQQVQPTWSAGQSSVDQIPVVALLYGFFHFYACAFPTSLAMISIKRASQSNLVPKTHFGKPCIYFCIEDPFETYDSYIPHDLGSPMNEVHGRKAIDSLHQAEEHLRTLLVQEGLPKNQRLLWPGAVVSTTNNHVTTDKQKRRRRPRGNAGKDSKKNENASKPAAAKSRGNKNPKDSQN